MKTKDTPSFKEIPGIERFLELARAGEKKYRAYADSLPVLEKLSSLQALSKELESAVSFMQKKLDDIAEKKKAGEDVLLQLEREVFDASQKAKKEAEKILSSAASKANETLREASRQADHITRVSQDALNDSKGRIAEKAELAAQLDVKIEEKSAELAKAEKALKNLLEKFK
jgi:hypothetical protein